MIKQASPTAAQRCPAGQIRACALTRVIHGGSKRPKRREPFASGEKKARSTVVGGAGLEILNFNAAASCGRACLRKRVFRCHRKRGSSRAAG
jgi:hypothetical protein